MPGNNQLGFVPGNYPVNQAPPNKSAFAAPSVSHSLDARIAVQTDISHSLDADVQVQTDKTHQLDARIAIQTDRSHSLDACIQVRTDKSHNLDVRIAIQTDRSHSLDARIAIQTSISHSLDTYIEPAWSRSHQLDAYILPVYSLAKYFIPNTGYPNEYAPNQFIQTGKLVWHSLDAYLVFTGLKSHSLDAYIQNLVSKTHSLDADIQVTTSVSHNLDADIQVTTSISHGLDADLQVQTNKSHNLDVWIQTSPAVSHYLDACIQTSSSVSHNLDACIQISGSVSHNLDAYMVQTVSKSHDLDAYISVPTNKSHNLDVDIQVTSTLSHSLDACLVGQRSLVHYLDAVIPGVSLLDHTLDAYISFLYVLSHSLSAYISQLAWRPIMTAKDIVLPSIKTLLPNQSFADEHNCVAASFTLNLTGGNFSLSLLRDSAALPPEDTILTLPIGRLAVVKNIGRGMNTGGLLDTISGPIVPYAATIRTFVAMLTDTLPVGMGLRMFASALAQKFGSPANGYLRVAWQAPDYEMRTYNFRGIALQGIQQLAGNFLYDVIVYNNMVYVVPAGQPIAGGKTWTVGDTDLISISQAMDFSADFPVYLNPMAIDWEGMFVYDEAHAQKQGRTTVQAGSNLGTGGTDFIPVPDGWMVEGEYEEWTPASGSTDLSNPNASVPKYWKIIPSPTNPGAQRGIISFTKLVRDLNLSPNLSRFVASPVTAATQSGANAFILNGGGGQNGLFGFSAEEYVITDILTDKQTTVKSAAILLPGSGDSGRADENFYSVPLEFWTFGRVSPLSVLPAGADPTNPNNIPPDVVLFTPSNSVKFTATFINNTLRIFATKNSPKMQTSISQIYRGQLPQPGDILVVPSADVPTCGRINSVTLNINRGGVTISLTAEVLGLGTIKGQLATI